MTGLQSGDGEMRISAGRDGETVEERKHGGGTGRLRGIGGS